MVQKHKEVLNFSQDIRLCQNSNIVLVRLLHKEFYYALNGMVGHFQATLIKHPPNFCAFFQGTLERIDRSNYLAKLLSKEKKISQSLFIQIE